MTRFIDWGRLEQAFKDAVGGLPNYKRTIAFEYVQALAEHISEQDKEITELRQHLAEEVRRE